jgi:hypothetical protein
VALALRDWLDHAYAPSDTTERSVTHENADAPMWISLACNGSAGHARHSTRSRTSASSGSA